MRPTNRREALICDICEDKEQSLQPNSREEFWLLEQLKNGGGSGGASSWNDLKDKPFEDNTVVYYEGNDLYSKCEKVADPEAPDGFFFKLSENVPSADDFICATCITNDGYVYTFAQHDIEEADGYVVFAGIFFLVSNETPFYGVTLGRGIWTLATLNDERFFTKIYKESIKKNRA